MKKASKPRFLRAAVAVLLALSLLAGGCGKVGRENASAVPLASVSGESGGTSSGASAEGDEAPESAPVKPKGEEFLPEESSAPESPPENSGAGLEEAPSSQEPAKTGASAPGSPNAGSLPEASATETAGPASGGFASPAVSGRLQVIGSKLCDSQGDPVQLRGISTHGLAWYPDYVNRDCFNQLRQQWQANAVRLAMYTGEYGGYCSGGDQEGLKELVRKGVSLAAEADLYAIVDWHILSDGNPNSHLEEAKSFFSEMAAEFSGYSHVLYEICNEPNGGVSWAQIKSYAQEVIPVIRAEDPSAVLLVGTPTWSQEVDKAAADPITGYENIMYTLHFYAATHKDSLRSTMAQAVEGGLPVFVSEYGICDASGNGAIDEAQAELWVQAMDRLGVSYMAWNLSNKGETSALLKSGCAKSSGFAWEDLSASGQWLYRLLTGGSALVSVGSASGSDALEGGTSTEAGSSSEERPVRSASAAPEPPAQGGSGEVSWSAIVENSWEAEGKTFRLYRLSIQNTGSAPVDGWEIIMEFEGGVSLSDSWCGEFSLEGGRLAVTPLDYNAQIPAGGAVDNVGFIVADTENH